MTGLLTVFLAHRAVFDLLSAGGRYCTATQEVRGAPPEKEILDADKPFETSSICNPTGLRLIAGRNKFMMFAPLEGWRDVKVTDRHTR